MNTSDLSLPMSCANYRVISPPCDKIEEWLVMDGDPSLLEDPSPTLPLLPPQSPALIAGPCRHTKASAMPYSDVLGHPPQD